MESAWKSAFPHCKFGISPFLILEDKYPDFRALVCEMDLKDLLIETDAPYLFPTSLDFRSPLLIRDITEELASTNSSSVKEIAEVTSKNAVDLYNMQ